MEYIVVASGIANLTSYFISKRIERTTTDHDSHQLSNSTGDQSKKSPSHQKYSAEASALKEKLDELRKQAKELSSPDTFVQYAKAVREANEVEKELKLKLESEGLVDEGQDLHAIVGKLSNAFRPRMSISQSKKAKAVMVKTILRIVVWVVLWLYFSWRSAKGHEDHRILFDCSDVRPLAFLVPKYKPDCGMSDWDCINAPPKCTISTTFALFLCNSAYEAMSL